MKTTIYIIKTTGINPAAFTPHYEAVRDSGSVDLVYLGAAPRKSDAPHDQYWLRIPRYPSTSYAREGVARRLNWWAEHSKVVAECVARAATDIVSGDYLVYGVGTPFPLHVSNVPEIRDQIGNMSL